MFDNGKESTYLPKMRDLMPSKKYRDAVTRWGEPNRPRKRVIIVNSINCDARNVEISEKQGTEDSVEAKSDGSLMKNVGFRSNVGDRCHSTSHWLQGGHVVSSGIDESKQRSSVQAEGYRNWLTERKKLRRDLSSCGLSKVWLSRKDGRTELENRVLKRMREKKIKIGTRNKQVLPHMIDEAEDTLSGQDRGVPTIRHPAPAALAIIEDYLARKKLRLVDLFQQADKDKSWTVTREEFMRIMKSVKMPLTEADLEDLIISLDKDNDNALDYRELAIGRQAYLEERIFAHSKMNEIDTQLDRNAATFPTARPESSSGERESNMVDSSVSPMNSKQRPGAPAVPSSPARGGRGPTTPPPRPPSAGRPLSPVNTLPVTQHGRSDSAGSRGRMTPVRHAASHDAISRSSSSPTLMVPPAQLADKVRRPSDEEVKEIRMLKQHKRKQKVKAQKRKEAAEKPLRQVASSSLGGATGILVDKYRQLTLKEYEDVVELCHMQGVQLSRPLLERVLLHPEDKPTSACITSLRKVKNTAGKAKRKFHSRTPGTARPLLSSDPSPVPFVKKKPRPKLVNPRLGLTS